MFVLTDFERLAEILYPNVTLTPEACEKKYPARSLKEGARVTRFAPSPTGFMHLGNMFIALIDKLTAEASGGVYYLRIEDTDKKREVENGVDTIIEWLSLFGLLPNEGMLGENKQSGAYGPYRQSLRRDIYECYAKELVKSGRAYPCFCSEEHISEMREKQTDCGETPGYYGKWAACRELSFDLQKTKIENGEPFVLRLRSEGNEERKVFVDDLIKGKLEMPENIMDVVLMKANGIPPYAFAHAVDDYLMKTTHVIRGDEWVASLPVHIQIFKALGFKIPKYVHVSPIMKTDGEGKRKLSKRKDPESAAGYYAGQGYPKDSVIEYLLTLVNSNFEEWRRANADKSYWEFPFNIKKMSTSGALFDIAKLTDVSKNVISVMSAEDVYSNVIEWAEKNDGELFALFTANPEYAKAVLNIDRENPKPRKDIAKWDEVKSYVSYFYSELYERDYSLPENISSEDAAAVLEAYLEVFDMDDKDIWFSKIKDLCLPLGYTPNVKEYKKNPDAFKGHVGDVSSVIRIALTSRTNTPDLHAIISLLGRDETVKRISDAKNFYLGK